MKHKTIAVTGASGLLGREIVKTLSKNAQVLSLDEEPPAIASPDFRKADVMDIDDLRQALVGVDAVVHLAALQLNAEQERIFSLNTTGTWNVFQAAEECGVSKVVLMSSECATGVVTLSDNRPAMPSYVPIDEAQPLRPNDAYSTSKLVCEAIAQAFAGRGQLDVVALRPTTVYGSGMEEDMRKAREQDDPYFWLYVEVGDVVEAVRLALDYEGPSYDCFFVSAKDTFSPYETLDFLEKKLGARPVVKQPDTYRRNPYATIYDLSKVEGTLGLTIRSDWRRYLALAG